MVEFRGGEGKDGEAVRQTSVTIEVIKSNRQSFACRGWTQNWIGAILGCVALLFMLTKTFKRPLTDGASVVVREREAGAKADARRHKSCKQSLQLEKRELLHTFMCAPCPH